MLRAGAQLPGSSCWGLEGQPADHRRQLLISIQVTVLVIHCHKTTFYRVLTAQRCRLSSLGPAVIGDQPKAAMRVADLGSRSLQVVYMVINIALGPRCTAAAYYSPRKIHFNPTPLSELPTPVRLSS